MERKRASGSDDDAVFYCLEPKGLTRVQIVGGIYILSIDEFPLASELFNSAIELGEFFKTSIIENGRKL